MQKPTNHRLVLIVVTGLMVACGVGAAIVAHINDVLTPKQEDLYDNLMDIFKVSAGALAALLSSS